jgi:hypothetical protein
MTNMQNERRAGGADTVEQALRIQACLGTVGAVEYLKGRAVDGAVIGRVLTGARVRMSDHAADRSIAR